MPAGRRRTWPPGAEDPAVHGHRIAVTAERDPASLAWCDLGADVVIEFTGRFRTREQAGLHLAAGARKVLLSVPGKDVDATVVMGVNEGTYAPERHHVISNASCTTYCVAPMVKVLDDRFGVVKGLMTTIHGYINDQVVPDGPHKDLRRGRSAAVNIIPTTTGAVRVPVEDGSLTDLTVVLDRAVSAGEINAAYREAAEGPLKDVLRVSDAPIVSRDVVGDFASCVLDAPLTRTHGDLVKVFGWYANEWGCTNRLLDLTSYVAARLPRN